MSNPRVVLNDFRKGQINVYGEGVLPEGAARRVQNLRLDTLGSLSVVGGQTNLFAARTNPVVSFLRYVDPEDASYRRMLISEKSGAGPLSFTYTVYLVNEADGTSVNLGNGTSYTYPDFLQVGRRVYINYSNTALVMWPGPGYTSMYAVGIAAPSSNFVSVTFNNTGTELNTTDRSPYQYTYTYVDIFGYESNPLTIAGVVTYSAGVTTDADGGRIDLVVPGFASSLIDFVRLYRIGGANATTRLVAELNWTGANISYTDQIPDANLSLTQLSLTHNTPPGDLRILELHKNRLWGAGIVGTLIGSPSRLWVSTYNEFAYWPPLPTGTELDGMYLTLDDNPEDNIVALSSLDSLLVVHRKNSLFFVYGDRANEFTFARRNVPGTMAKRSVVKYDYGNFRYARDGQVYYTTERGDIIISGKIEKRLDEVAAASESLLPNACAAYFNNEYHLHIPNPGGTPYVFIFDTGTGKWSEGDGAWREGANSDDKLHHAVQLGVYTGTDDGKQQLLMAPVSGYTDHSGSAYNGVVRLENPAGSGNRVVEWESDWLDFGYPGWITSVASIKIEGLLTTPGTSPVPTVSVSSLKRDGSTTNSASYNLAASNPILVDREPSLGLMGIKHKVRVYGKITTFYIKSIEIGYRVHSPVRG